MASVLIKGTRQDAVMAANRFGISLYNVTQQNAYGETLANTNAGGFLDDSRLYAWFGETGECVDGVGFPAGTLLHFNPNS